MEMLPQLCVICLSLDKTVVTNHTAEDCPKLWGEGDGRVVPKEVMEAESLLMGMEIAKTDMDCGICMGGRGAGDHAVGEAAHYWLRGRTVKALIGLMATFQPNVTESAGAPSRLCPQDLVSWLQSPAEDAEGLEWLNLHVVIEAIAKEMDIF